MTETVAAAIRRPRCEMRLRLVKRFGHKLGRWVLAHHYLAEDSWLGAEREPPDRIRRHRWYTMRRQIDHYLHGRYRHCRPTPRRQTTGSPQQRIRSLLSWSDIVNA